MQREIWILRHGHRRDYEPGWEKSKRWKENFRDPPLSKYGFKLAKKGAKEFVKKSEAVKEKKIKFIYCSPYTRCIQTAIEMIKAVKKEIKYDIKLIIVYNLGESGWFARYQDFNVKDGKLLIKKKEIIDSKMKPDYLKKKYKNYIHKFIGSDIKDVTYDKELQTMLKTIISIENKENNSFVIVGHLDTARIAYKYFYNDKKIPDWVSGGPDYCNIMMGFIEDNNKYEMLYKPNNKF